MRNPKTGAPKSDFPSKITLCFSSPKAKPDTRASGRNTDQARQPEECKLLRNSVDGAPWSWAMRSLLKYKCPSPSLYPMAQCSQNPLCTLPQPPSRPKWTWSGTGNPDVAHGELADLRSVIAGSSSQGLASNPPGPGLSPLTSASFVLQEAKLTCQGHIGEVCGETSAVKSCG